MALDPSVSGDYPAVLMDQYAERRRQLLETIDGVAVLASSPVTIRNNDVEHEYRQDSDLYYFTGFDEPGCVLLLSTVHSEHREVMFVQPRDKKREIWDGARAGVEGAQSTCGVDATFDLKQLAEKLPGYFTGAKQLYYELGRQAAMDEQIFSAIAKARGKGRTPKLWPGTIRHPEAVWHELRLRKSEEELRLMRRAASITAQAHRQAMRQAAPGKHEYEIEATLQEVFCRNGARRTAYAPIVGSGPNATVLHYTANDRRIQDGDLVLIDAGCEYRYYAADITRTFPVNGRFTPPQREIYDVVLRAQQLAVAAVRPGTTIEKVHDVVLRKIVAGLIELGLLEGEADSIIKKKEHKRFFPHRSSHWLGMDVHDVGAYFIDGEARQLEPSMVLTIEPGVYIAADDEKVDPAYRGIGIRIEDDVLVTADGHEVLTAAVPKTIAEVERACC